MSLLSRWALGITLCGLLGGSPAAAQNLGFQVARYQPAPAGEWGFAVDHPWYSATRSFAASLTLDYGHSPLSQSSSGDSVPILAHQLLGHLDLAGSLLDRLTVSLSLPVTLLEQGQALGGVIPTSPTVGDPRLGVMVRIFGQPERSPLSLSLGGSLWVPLRSGSLVDRIPAQSSDTAVRGQPKLVLAGLTERLRWSLSLGFLIRPAAVLGSATAPATSPVATAGSEVQLGALVQYADVARRFAIGPEFLVSSALGGSPAEVQAATSIELLLGAMVQVARPLQLGLAGGAGIHRTAGSPDGRLLFRLAYAPLGPPPAKRDRDHDGIPDLSDRCPDEAQGSHPDPARPGCPQSDRDGDGVDDSLDQCPDIPQADHPDAARLGCPILDRDEDGIVDDSDLCPDIVAGPHPDPSRPGCPLMDRDGDGIFDVEDRCPEQPAGKQPDPERPGCPLVAQPPPLDSDGDGTPDRSDLCPSQASGLSPDPARLGCPAADRDGDGVADALDACPTRPGAPALDLKRNGCPGLVSIRGGTLALLQPIVFDFNKDSILPASLPLLNAVVDALKAKPELRKLAIEGHTDSAGNPDANRSLSTNRASSVLRYLTAHGIDPARLESHGYGDSRPIADNRTVQGRGRNRRVVLVIVDPAAPVAAPPPAAK